MCGICGFTNNTTRNKNDNERIVHAMMDKIAHRGPDSAGSLIEDDVVLGFRRLSIIGLEDGSQPMFNEDKSIVVVFNGEIYNYQILKTELTEKGHVFANNADTEVLLHLYEEYGYDMLNHLRGMFAFVIYDFKKGQLFGARDFFGIKPFYYTSVGGDFVFASEIKALLAYPGFQREVNLDALENYLTFQYSVLEETFFKGVFKLQPGHYFTYHNGKLDICKYFDPSFSPEDISLTQTCEMITSVMKDSVESHKISDVEVGSFLSSGVDSSYVAATFGGDKTFTVGFDYDNYNEISYAKDLSAKIGIENFSKTITTDEYWDALGKVQYHMDEPLGDPSAVALYFVSQTAAKHVKVALSGEGADEFFGGYNIYREPLDLQIITWLPKPLRKLFARIARVLPGFKGKNFLIRASKSIEERFIGNANIFTVKERNKLLKTSKGTDPAEITAPVYAKAAHHDTITKMQHLDIHLWLVGDILLKADKMSMAHSLEVRVPYLDKEVFKTASKIPTGFRVNRLETKYAFRLMTKEYLPENVSEKKKLGFPVPIRIWLREDKFYNRVKESFTSSASAEFFNTDELVALLDSHKSGKRDVSRRIWTVYMFLVWHNEFFGSETA